MAVFVHLIIHFNFNSLEFKNLLKDQLLKLFANKILVLF